MLGVPISRQAASTLFGKWQHNAAVKSLDSGDRLPGFHFGQLLNLSVPHPHHLQEGIIWYLCERTVRRIHVTFREAHSESNLNVCNY